MAVWTVINHTELGSAASSYEVTSIPSSYDHLYLLTSCRSSRASNYVDEHWLRFNNDTGYNYSSTALYSGSTAIGSNRNGGANKIENLYLGGASVNANAFTNNEIWIPNYANTSGYKQVLAQNVIHNDSTTNWQFGTSMVSALWDSTAAINRVTLVPKNGDDYLQYSTFTLYGVTNDA